MDKDELQWSDVQYVTYALLHYILQCYMRVVQGMSANSIVNFGNQTSALESGGISNYSSHGIS